MYVAITTEISADINEKFIFVDEAINALKSHFSEKFYGEDLQRLYIGVICVNPQFDKFFKIRAPKYSSEGKETIGEEVKVKMKPKSLEYDLKMDYEMALKEHNIRRLLSIEVLKSLDIIKEMKKIKDFDLGKFSSDFEEFFRSNAWL